MPENSNADGESDKTKKNNNRAQHKVVWAIVAGGIIGVLVILFVSLFFPNLTERTKFFTTNALSVLVLDVIIVQAYIYRKQWEAMQSQLRLMRATEETLRRQASTLERQASAFEAQVATTQEAMRRQVDSNEDTRQQTNQIILQNQESIAIAQQNMIYAQRAYVTIPRGSIQTDDNGARFYLTVMNSGNTPAHNVEFSAVVECREDPPEPDRNINSLPGGEPVMVGLIGPGHDMNQENDPFKPSEEQTALIQAGKMKLYCQGIVNYLDIFDQPRYTRFSFVQKGWAAGRFGPCKNGNEAK